MSEETVLACPDCDSSRLLSLQRQKPAGLPAEDTDADGSHRCKDCENIVTPVERPAHRSGKPTNGLAAELFEAEQGAI